MSNANEHAHPKWLAHHFYTGEQQKSAAKLGMWLFLAQEILFFSGLFMAYAAFRYFYPETYLHAHEHLDWKLGAVNTVVLLFSSLTVALAVRCAQTNNRQGQVINLAITILCACIFLVIKYFEYSAKFEHGLLPGDHWAPHEVMDGKPWIFFGIYFTMTGLHGLHVIVGIGVLLWILVKAQKGHFNSDYYAALENSALYWHLVDLIWIFLFPLLYLVR